MCSVLKYLAVDFAWLNDFKHFPKWWKRFEVSLYFYIFGVFFLCFFFFSRAFTVFFLHFLLSILTSDPTHVHARKCFFFTHYSKMWSDVFLFASAGQIQYKRLTIKFWIISRVVVHSLHRASWNSFIEFSIWCVELPPALEQDKIGEKIMFLWRQHIYQ